MRSKSRFLNCCFLVGAWALPFQAIGKVDIKTNGTTTIYTIEIEDLEWQDFNLEGKLFSKLTLKGVDDYSGIIHNVGAPEVPVIRLYAPGKATVRPLETQGILTLQDKYPLIPVQKPREKIPYFGLEVAFDATIYQSAADYPSATFYEVEPSGSIRGVKQNLVTLFPVLYSPKTSTYKVVKKFEVTIESTATPEDLRPETVVLIVGPRFSKSISLKALAKHKASLGYQVINLVVSSGETPDSIRLRLKELYQKANLRYGLIIGDQTDVPGKESDIISGVTDHYYRAIDTDDYPQDINGPDVGIGRISIANEAQLEKVVDKMIRYDRGSFVTTDWLQKISWLATDDRWEVAEGTHNYVIDTHTKKMGFNGVFPESDQKGGDQLYAVTHQVDDPTVVRTIGLGRSIINYSGHGSQDSWAGPHVSQANVRQLKDLNALPFVVSNACITADFRVEESFGETWQRHPAGAIAFWGSMDSSYWDEDDLLERRMYDGIFRKNHGTFAQITQASLAEVWRHYGGRGRSAYYWETYVLLGDPSQYLRFAEPQIPEGTLPSKLAVGSLLAKFNLTSKRGALPGVKVSANLVSPSGEDLGASVTSQSNDQGLVELPLKNLTTNPGLIRVTLSGRNLKIRQETISVIKR